MDDREYTEDANLAALADGPVDMGEVDRGAKDASIAKGWYVTDPENSTVTVGIAKDSGRNYARYFGKVVGPEETMWGFGWSWERRNRITKDGENTGKPDNMYQTYINLVTLYTKVHRESPKRVSDLNAWVRRTPLQVNIIQGKSGGNFLGNGQPFKVAE